MYTILMLNQKGGVGKTTIADELSFALERRGKTVAFVTTDPQGGSVHEVCDDPDFAEECDFQVVDTAGVLDRQLVEYLEGEGVPIIAKIPRAVALSRAAAAGVSVAEYDPKSHVVAPIELLADSVLNEEEKNNG